MTGVSPTGLADGVAAVAGLAQDAMRIGTELRRQAAVVRRASRTEWHSGAADAFEGDALDEARRLDRCAELFGDLAADLSRHARTAHHRAEELADLARRARDAIDGVRLDDYLGRDS